MPRYSVQVTWLDTGECFPTIAEAARHMPLSLPSLENARRGGKSEACGLKVAFKIVPEMQPNCKPVKNLTTGEVFPSLTAAAEACGGTRRGVSQAIKNRRKYHGQWWRCASKKALLTAIRRASAAL